MKTEDMPFGLGRGRGPSRRKEIKMNDYNFKMETIELSAKTVSLDMSGYMNVNAGRYQDYTACVRRVRGNLKHKSYQLCQSIFPTMIPETFIFDFDTSECSPIQIYRKSNHFTISIVIRFPHPVDVRDKDNIDLETFASELLFYMTQRYDISPFSAKKLKELEMSVIFDYSSVDIDLNESEHQNEILTL